MTLCGDSVSILVLSPLLSLHSRRARQVVVIADRHSAQQWIEGSEGCACFSLTLAGYADNTLNFLKRHLNQHCSRMGALREESHPDPSLRQ